MAELGQVVKERYWSQDIQIETKLSLLSAGSMRDYATNKAAALKLCDSPMYEEEIVGVLTRHFPLQTQNVLKSVSPMPLQKFLVLLGNYDQTFETARNNNNPRINSIAYSDQIESGTVRDPREGRIDVQPYQARERNPNSRGPSRASPRASGGSGASPTRGQLPHPEGGQYGNRSAFWRNRGPGNREGGELDRNGKMRENMNTCSTPPVEERTQVRSGSSGN